MMIRILLSCSIALLLCGRSAAQDWNTTRTVDGAAHYNAGRGVFVPRGAETPYLTLTVHDDWELLQKDRQVSVWFQTDPRLMAIKQQCHFNWFTLSNPHFRDRLAPCYGTNAPIVTLQTGGNVEYQGRVLLNVTAGENMPDTPGELADLLAQAIDANYPAPKYAGGSGGFTPIERERGGPCPGPDPCPGPGPCPVQPYHQPNPVLPYIPDVLPDGGNDLTLAVVGLVAVGAVAACVVALRRKPTSDEPLD